MLAVMDLWFSVLSATAVVVSTLSLFNRVCLQGVAYVWKCVPCRGCPRLTLSAHTPEPQVQQGLVWEM